jgi:enoyl-CoA hydratase
MPAKPTATIALQTYQERFASLQFAQPEVGILEIVISNPKHLNAADASTHRDLALVWREIDLDAAVSAVLVRGEGGHFSSGGKPIVSAIRGTAVGAGLAAALVHWLQSPDAARKACSATRSFA